MRIRPLVFALILAVGATTTACARMTTVEHVWRSPDWPESFTHVAVFGVSKRPGVRRSFETQMAAALGKIGVRATPSFQLFPGDSELRSEDIARVLGERGIDGALVVRLVAIDRERRFVGGGGPYPYPMFGPRYGFYGHYHGAWAMTYAPGYMVDFDIFTIETNLYDVASSELVWSGLSETFDPRTVDRAIRSYTRTMVKALDQTELLQPTAGVGGARRRG